MIKGVTKISAAVVYGEIRNSFWGPRFNPLRSIFHLDPSKQNLSIKEIPNYMFESAITGLSPDERALAYAYFLCINSKDVHQVEVISLDETLSQAGCIALQLPQNSKGKDVDKLTGGGRNNRCPGGTFTVIVEHSKVVADDYLFITGTLNQELVPLTRHSTPAEVLAHEVLGHGYGRMINSPGNGHEDAIQMNNLYWRVRGYNRFYRDGRSHGKEPVILCRELANSIPAHFRK